MKCRIMALIISSIKKNPDKIQKLLPKTSWEIFIWQKAIIYTSWDFLNPLSRHWREVIRTPKRWLRPGRRGEHVVVRENAAQRWASAGLLQL